MEQGTRWRRLGLGGLVAALGVVGLDAGTAVWAQNAGRADARLNDYPFYDYSLTKHLVAMLVLAVVTVGVATGLARIGHRWPALAVITGVVAGPMTVIAAPVNARLVSVSFDDTVARWHLLVGTPQALILVLATVWTTRQLPGAGHEQRDTRRDTALFLLVAATVMTFQILTSQGIPQEPHLLPVVGWAVVAAGVAVLVRPPAPAWAAPVLLVSWSVALTTLYLAYTRHGGWPGVAGWETYAQQPIVLSWSTPVVVLTIPALVVIARLWARVPAAGRRPRPSPGTPAPAAR